MIEMKIDSIRFEYRIEVIRFNPQPVQLDLMFSNAADAAAAIAEISDETVLIDITQRRNHFCVGDFVLWRTSGRALVRIGEHREHNARQRFTSTVPEGKFDFRDDVGSAFVVPLADTIDIDIANAALMHWLATGEATDALLWS